jgi:CheY-like chemotaxis protein
VLIVEDEWPQAVLLEKALVTGGHTICGTASSAESALALASLRRPEVVVMDVRLGGDFDGVKAATAIQALCGSEIVFVTAYAHDPIGSLRMRLRQRHGTQRR